MRIIYINHYAGAPKYGMEYRPYYLSREWVRSGHQVLILAADYSHVRSRQPQRPSDRSSRWNEQIDGIDYQWYATPPYRGNGVTRVRNIATFLTRVALDTGRLAQEYKPDVVIASSTYPMDIWIARRLARKGGSKLVFEVHDLWPLSPIEIGGMSPTHPFIRLCQAAENAAYRDADLVVSMLPNVQDYAASKGVPSDRLAIVPNGITLDEWTGRREMALRKDLDDAIRIARSSGERVLVYAGSHGLPNALDTLLDAAALLRNDPLTLILVGDGHERVRLQARVREEGLVRVQMFEPVPKSQVAALLANADMAYLGAPRHPIYRFGVAPNKMIDYMMAGVPILFAIEAGNDPVAEADCGLTVPAENPQALANAIRALCATPPGRLKSMGENGKRYALDKHTYDMLSKAFLDAMLLIPRKS